MRLIALVLLVLVACNEASVPLQPFQLPAWTAMPTDDELVAAIVGRGGSASERARVEQAVRDLMLPVLRQEPDLRALQSRLESDKRELSSWSLHQYSPADRVVRICVVEELGRLQYRAMLLAEHRLHLLLWPKEPVPERWAGVAELEPLLSTERITAAAHAVEQRVRDIDQRYRLVPVGDQRAQRLIVHYVYVASSGDYRETTGPIYDELSGRGLETMPLAGANPW